jgi:hypothetical protein
MLLSDAERAQAAADVGALIASCGQRGEVFRAVAGERLYGSDPEGRTSLGTIALEFIADPPEDLGQKIDATASVLPDADVRAEDELRFEGVLYRIQSVQEERLFGALTHKTLALVRLHAR